MLLQEAALNKQNMQNFMHQLVPSYPDITSKYL